MVYVVEGEGESFGLVVRVVHNRAHIKPQRTLQKIPKMIDQREEKDEHLIWEDQQTGGKGSIIEPGATDLRRHTTNQREKHRRRGRPRQIERERRQWLDAMAQVSAT